jgi:hypothetical protein
MLANETRRSVAQVHELANCETRAVVSPFATCCAYVHRASAILLSVRLLPFMDSRDTRYSAHESVNCFEERSVHCTANSRNQ